jgi:RimJ/RimL family protein N-acetyltransferase
MSSGSHESMPFAEPIETSRLVLSPIVPGDADGLVVVLGDRRLHSFTGGVPDTLPELRARFAGWSSQRSPDGTKAWLNWAMRTNDGRAIGTVQATVMPEGSAEVAWVVGVDHQGQGFASEAARALVTWLGGKGVIRVAAHVHPDHAASAGVARAAGFEPTDELVDGEVVWRREVAGAPDAG